MSRLGIVKRGAWSAANGLVAQDVVAGIVHSEGEVGEEEIGANVTEAERAAARHLAVPAERVERGPKAGYVECISDENCLAVEAEFGRP